MIDWQPIETAPFGIRVQLRHPQWRPNVIVVGVKESREHWWEIEIDGFWHPLIGTEPDGWRPL